ncbi:MAG: hypothetical protein GTO62_05105 [Planctomycetales bacterium]|nr:hypothetical protein [Planctomycetales bacterium]NIP68630.1 hypothetical protein [Planctomycetales bacterium]
MQPLIRHDSVSIGDTVQTLLLATKARQLGYEATDLEITRYLYALVDNKLNEDQLKAEMIGADRRFSLRGIYEVLREEMLAQKLFEDFYRGWQAAPPGQQLEYYARLHRRIQLELLSVPVESFLSDVPEPSEEELSEYFAKYKTRLQPVDFLGGQSLLAADPGFKLPHRVSVEYVMGHVEELMDEVRDEIREEEIAAYYEENKVSDERLHAEDELALPDIDPQNANDEQDKTDPDAEQPEKGKDAGNQEEEPVEQKEEADQPEENSSQEKPLEFKPLDEVRDDIHQILARRRAAERLEEKFAAISGKMDAYYQARIYAEPGEQPTYRRPDIEAAAKEQGLKYEKQELLSARQFRDQTHIGRSRKTSQPTEANFMSAATLFPSLVFEEGEQSWFSPQRTVDDDDIQYLFWKTNEELETIPDLNAVRDQVVRAWRMGAGRFKDDQTARQRARAWAETAAQQVQDGNSLAKVAQGRPGSQLRETEYFSWLTTGSAPSFNPLQSPPVRLSTVGGVDQVGPEFMKAVFAARPGQAVVAMNHPQTNVYVAKVLQENKSPATIEQNFLDALGQPMVANQIQQAARLDWRGVQKKWLDQLDEEFDVVWLQPDLQFRDN